MKIQNTYSNSVQKNTTPAQTSELKKAEAKNTIDKSNAAKVEAKSNSNAAAQSEISSRGKEFAKAFAIASETPDVREDRVMELRKKIQSGEYKVDAEAIAEKMMNEQLL